MESKSILYDIIVKMALSLFILSASILFTKSTWAYKSSESGPELNFKDTVNIAYRGRIHYRNPSRFRAGFYFSGSPAWGYRAWGYRPAYWGPWTPYWTGGVYCRRSCMVNSRGRVIRCRVRCL